MKQRMIFAFIVLSMAGSLNAQLVAVTDNVCSKLAVQDDAILFAKDSPEYGCELWAFSNGTTELFADITPGPASTRPGIEATLGSALIIRSGVLDDDIVPWTVAAFRDGELIPFDNIVGVVGTFAEQVLLVDRNGDDLLAYDGDEMRFLHSGVHGYKSGLVDYEGRAYFGAVWQGIGLEPSYFDGTSVELLENVTNPGNTWPTGFRVAGGDLYFRNGTNALFKYDGTEVSLIDQFRLEPGVVGNITEFHGEIYFDAADHAGEFGSELWRINEDAPRGYELVKDFNAGPANSWVGMTGAVDYFPIFQDRMLLYATDEVGRDLWSFDGESFVKGVPEIMPWKDSEWMPLIMGSNDQGLFYWAERQDGEIWFYQHDGNQMRALLSLDEVPRSSNGFPKYSHFYNALEDAVLFEDELYFSWNEKLWRIPAWPEAMGCDVNQDYLCDHLDIDVVSTAIRANEYHADFDFNADGVLDDTDREFLVSNEFHTFAGDANLDGIFNSNDMVIVFQMSEYEDSVLQNSGWKDGDWNGDGEFTSGDLVLAFQTGKYDAKSVPEPDFSWLVLFAVAILIRVGRMKSAMVRFPTFRGES